MLWAGRRRTSARSSSGAEITRSASTAADLPDDAAGTGDPGAQEFRTCEGVPEGIRRITPFPSAAPRVLPWNAGRLAASLVASERIAASSTSLVIG